MPKRIVTDPAVEHIVNKLRKPIFVLNMSKNNGRLGAQKAYDKAAAEVREIMAYPPYEEGR